jgi:hypothetical protein
LQSVLLFHFFCYHKVGFKKKQLNP